jgi:hypothetical protein
MQKIFNKAASQNSVGNQSFNPPRKVYVWRLAITLPAMKTFLKQSELSAFRDSTQPHPARNMI